MNEQKLLDMFFTNNLILIVLIVVLILYFIGTIGIIGLLRHNSVKFRYFAWLYPINIYYLIKLGLGKYFSFISFIGLLLISDFKFTINGKNFSLNYIIPKNMSNVIILGVYLFIMISLYKIYKNYSKNYVIYTILTVLTLGIVSPVFLFVIRNNQRAQFDLYDDINVNSNVYINKLNKIKNKKEKESSADGKYVAKSEKEVPYLEEEYVIKDFWDGPK